MVMAIYSTKDKVVNCRCNLTGKRKTFKHNSQQAFTTSCRSQSVDMQRGNPEVCWVNPLGSWPNPQEQGQWAARINHKSKNKKWANKARTIDPMGKMGQPSSDHLTMMPKANLLDAPPSCLHFNPMRQVPICDIFEIDFFLLLFLSALLVLLCTYVMNLKSYICC